MQTYTHYKDSGIDWIGQIPEHWELEKFKYLGFIYPGLSGKKGDDFNKEIFEGAKEFVPFTTICNYSQIKDDRFQYVRISQNEIQNKVIKNDLLFLMSSETLNDIAKTSVYLLDKSSYLNSFCKGFRISSTKLNSIFTNYLLSSKNYRNYYELCGRGFTRINIKQEYINDTIITIPPIHEQEAIANFLDEKTAKIDALVQTKEQQIEKLKELRQAKIHQAVSKGIPCHAELVEASSKTHALSKVEMKDSGVPWIGEIPAHWGVKRFKNVLKEINYRSKSGEEELLSLSKYRGIIPKSELEERAGGALSLIGYKVVSKHNIVINKMQAVNGLIGVSKLNGITSPDYSVYDTIIDCPEYIGTLMSLPLYLDQYKKVVTGVMEGFIRLYTDDLFNIACILPPIQEQEQIVAYLDEVTGKINQAIAQKQEQITKLKEYKQSLINDVVTGKVKVC